LIQVRISELNFPVRGEIVGFKYLLRDKISTSIIDAQLAKAKNPNNPILNYSTLLGTANFRISL